MPHLLHEVSEIHNLAVELANTKPQAELLQKAARLHRQGRGGRDVVVDWVGLLVGALVPVEGNSRT